MESIKKISKAKIEWAGKNQAKVAVDLNKSNGPAGVLNCKKDFDEKSEKCIICLCRLMCDKLREN